MDLECDADFSAIDRFTRGRIVVDAKLGSAQGAPAALGRVWSSTSPELTKARCHGWHLGQSSDALDPARICFEGERTFHAQPPTLGLLHSGSGSPQGRWPCDI